MKQLLVSLISGILFGFGLGLSQMIDRGRAINFLDIAGTWDPTLLFVLSGAVFVTVIAFRFVLRQKSPFFNQQFVLPTRQDIDGPLIIGSAIFGIGWGISGYCPGTGVVALVLGSGNPVLFLLAVISGMSLNQLYRSDLTF